MATDVQAPVPTGAPAAELCAPKTASEPAPALTIPVIDISGYLAGTPGAAVQTAAALRAAATAPGFFQIVGHPVSADLRHRLLAALTEFFALPDETKQALHRRNSPCLRGYEGLSEQELEPGVRDQKEGFMIGREPRVAALDEAPPPLRFAQGPNQWPDEAACPGFRDVMTEYFDAMRQLTIVMFRLMALGLGLEEHYFDVFADSPDSVTMCRAHRYPPTPPEAAEKNKGIGAHTDFGALTLLLQDDIGGLEVFHRPSQTWYPVTPVADAYVVNIGDMMERWTNDHYTSTLHRVISPVSERYRYSVAFFNEGLLDQVIECISTCLAPGEAPRHAPVVVESHLRDRYTRSF